MNKIVVMPNQSIPDIILQGCGSLEAGMQFCRDNDISIAQYPDIGTVYTASQTALAAGDPGVLQYLAQNNIVIGTLGSVPDLGYSIMLKPVMHAVPTVPDPPSVSGYYVYDLIADPGAFINVNPIASLPYPSLDNIVCYETEERFIAGLSPDTRAQNPTTLLMSYKQLSYNIPWISGRGFMMIWSDLSSTEKTATFVDDAGYKAYVSPLIVLDNVTQTVEEYLIADLAVGLVSAGRNSVTLRLTRSHSPIGHIDFITHSMSWLHDAAGGTPDPLDPGNPDKTIVTLVAGTYSFGVGTIYINGTTTYPASSFSMVVKVS